MGKDVMNTTVREFRTAKGWRIFVYVLATPCIVAFIGLAVMPFFPEMDAPAPVNFFLSFIGLGMAAVFTFGILDVARGKFVIAPDRVYSNAELSKRELFFHEIAGFRQAERYLFIEPLPGVNKKRIKISNYYSGKEEIIHWLSARYPDLQQVEANREAVEILNEKDYGISPVERADRLKKAKRISLALNVSGGASAAWLFFYPKPYAIAVSVAILIPLVSVFVMRHFNGLIRLDNVDKSPYPSVIFALLLPSCMVLVRALTDFNFVSYDSLLMLSALVAVFMTILLLLTVRKEEWKKAKTWATACVVAALMFAYGFGTIACMNAVGDDTLPDVYQVKILGKRITSGKTTTYYLKLEPWGPVKEADEVVVTEDVFDRSEINELVDVYLSPGLFTIPWFEVAEGVE